MNTAEFKFFSEETGYLYQNFSRHGNEFVFNKENAERDEAKTGYKYIGESLAELPYVLTENQFIKETKETTTFRYSLPSAYIDGGRVILPAGFTGPHNLWKCEEDLRISYANFLKEVCTEGSTYLTQIKKWNCDGQWLATFDFSVEKPQNVHLIYDGEQKGKDPYWEIYGAGLTKANVDVLIPYDDFFVKYDALDPQCYGFESGCSDTGIPVGELVEPITSDNRGCLGRIDVDFANFTSDDAQKDKHLSEDFQKYLIDKKTDKGFLPHMTLENQDGIPYGYLLKKGEDQNWLPIYVNVYLWKHRGEWLLGQRPYFTDMNYMDKRQYEGTRCKQRNAKKLLVKMPIDMKGNLAAQMREVYIAYQEWRNEAPSCPSPKFDVLFSDAVRLYGKLNTAWNQINDGKYKNFESVVDCLNSIRESFPSYAASYDDIQACMISDIHNATKASQASDEMASRSFKSTLGILCSHGFLLPEDEIEQMCVDFDMADLLENSLYPRNKAYLRFKKFRENKRRQTKTAIEDLSIFNFDCFDSLFKQYAEYKLLGWEIEFNASGEELRQKLLEADKQDIQKATERADEEAARAKKSEEDLQVQKAMGTSVAHEINNRLDHALSNLKELSEVCISETTKIKKIMRFIRPISTRVHLIRYAYGNKEKLTGDTMTLQLKQIVVDALHEALEDVMGKTDSPYRKNYIKSGCDKNAIINNEIGVSNFDFTETYFKFIYNDDDSSGNIHTCHDYIAVISLLLHEYLLNAIKNTSFLPKEARRIQLKITSDNNKIVFYIQNTFNVEYKDEKNYFSEHGISLTKCLLQKVGEICCILPIGNEYNVRFSVNLPEGDKQ